MPYAFRKRCGIFQGHNWRTLDRIKSRGTILQQCKKCDRTREINPQLRFVVGTVVVVLLVIVLLYWLSMLQQ